MKRWLAWLIQKNNNFLTSARCDCDPDWRPGADLLALKLDQKRRVDLEPMPLLCVISRSEDHIDVCDWAYKMIGIGTFAPFVVALIGSWFTLRSFMPSQGVTHSSAFAWFAIGFSTLLISAPAIWCGRLILLQITGYTHYPVRLDRKNRMVHAFRHNGKDGVLSLPWDEITFGMGTGESQQGFRSQGISGYRQREDGSFDWFRLGVMDPEPDGRLAQWEYFRRFMEEGPEELPEPDVILHIDERRESFNMGSQFCWYVAGGNPFVVAMYIPFTVPFSVVRWILLRLSRKPRWPAHILAMTPVSPDDAYAHLPRPSLDARRLWVVVVTVVVLALEIYGLWQLLSGRPHNGYQI